MAIEICPYCGESHLNICLGEHMEICKKENPKRIFSLYAIVERLDRLEGAIAKKGEAK